MLGGELDNAGANQVRDLFVHVPDFGPEVGIVLFVLGNDASLRSVARNTSKQFLVLQPDTAVPFPMKEVARMVPSTVWTLHTAK